MSRICQQGFEDALKFLARSGLISCTKCYAIQSCITVSVEDLTQGATKGAGENVPLSRCAGLTTATSESEFENPQKCPHRRPQVGQKLRRSRTVSSGMLRRSRSSLFDLKECKECRQTEALMRSKGLPNAVTQPLSEAVQNDRTLLGYLRRSRIWRLIRVATYPYTWLPWDLTYTFLQKMIKWAPNLPSDIAWVIERAISTIKFLLTEIEFRSSSLYNTRFTCQLAIKEVKYNKLSSETQSSSNEEENPKLPVPTQERAPSPPAVGAKQIANNVYCDESEIAFGFTADLNARSRPVKKMAEIMGKSCPTKSEYWAKDLAKATENLEWAGLRATANQMQGLDEQFGTFAKIVEYSRQHDSLMAFYYLDENKQVKMTEIFDVEGAASGKSNTGSDQKISEPGGTVRKHSIGNRLPSSLFKRGDDSGLSLAEESPRRLERRPSFVWPSRDDEQKRDACCSPVKEFEQGPTTSRKKKGLIKSVSGKLKKRGSTNSAEHLRERPAVSGHRVTFAAGLVSDDDDEDRDKFFVPERRKRISSREYDAENEVSPSEE